MITVPNVGQNKASNNLLGLIELKFMSGSPMPKFEKQKCIGAKCIKFKGCCLVKK